MKPTSIVTFVALVSLSFSSSPQSEIPPRVNKHVVTIREFEGERLGESIETFKSRHPSAECKLHQFAKEPAQFCVIYEGLSIAGTSLESVGQDCHSPKPVNCYQWMEAIFTPHLEVLEYRVKTKYRPLIVTALYKKYGEPSFGELDGSWTTTWAGEDTKLTVEPFVDIAGKVETFKMNLSVLHDR